MPKPIYIDDHDNADWIKKVSNKTIKASARLEFGDYVGHPFHGNQWTGGTGTQLKGNESIDDFLARNPRQEGEDIFVYQGRIVQGLSDADQNKVLYNTRELYEPCGYIKDGIDKWCADHNCTPPPDNCREIPVDLEEAERVAKYFENTPDQSDDPRVRAAYEDFKAQSEEMYSFMTKPVGEGGLGITVDYTKATDPYDSAKAQADDLRDNRHITIQSGLGGAHEATMTVDEYDRFRAVHDVFGHAGVGGGFDRHGEYEAWLAHASMYTGAGRAAMSTEYHAVNSALWSGDTGSPGTGKSILLPGEYADPPWERHSVTAAASLSEADISELIKKLGLDDTFASKFDDVPWHPHGKITASAQLDFSFDEDEHPRDEKGRFTKSGGSKSDDAAVSKQEHEWITQRQEERAKAIAAYEKVNADRLSGKSINTTQRTPEERTHIRMQGMQGHTSEMDELQAHGERIAAALPFADVDISQNVDPRYLKAAAESAEQFAAEFPRAAESVRYMISNNGDPSTIALVRSAPQGLSGFGVTYPLEPAEVGIELNERYFSPSAGRDLDEVVSKAAEQTHVGDAYSVPFHRTDDIKGLIDHEFGHVLDHADGNQVSYIDTETARQLSQYAQTNTTEAFAEAFAMRQAGMPLPTNAQHEVDAVISRLGPGDALSPLFASAWIGNTTCAGYIPLTLLASAQLEFTFDPDEPRDEKGEWTSTGGEPRLAPWERDPKGAKDPGKALPFETTSMKGLPKDIQKAVMETIRDKVGSTQAINANLNHYLDYAMNDPVLREEGMNWYQNQHDVAVQIGIENGIPTQNVAAALAAMSSGTTWEVEEPILRYMADHMDSQLQLSDEKLDMVNAKLDAYEVVDRGKEIASEAKDKESETYAAMRDEFPTSADVKAEWADTHPGYDEKSLNRADSTLYGEIMARRENEAGLIPPSPDRVDNSMRYSDLDSKVAVIAMQAQFMMQPSVADGGTRTAGWGAGHGWDGFAKGFTLMKDGTNVDDTLFGPKVRSFTNNIMDPSDPRDVTVDVHMVSAAARNPAIINDSSVMGSPRYETASIGAYPYIADRVRAIAEQNGILPQQAQALMWVGFLAEQQDQADAQSVLNEWKRVGAVPK